MVTDFRYTQALEGLAGGGGESLGANIATTQAAPPNVVVEEGRGVDVYCEGALHGGDAVEHAEEGMQSIWWRINSLTKKRGKQKRIREPALM